ncbi:MAG TPA: hypothetical protein VGT08_03450, partial [Terracidiphilus sp.]|nr:hypothetical protein [Terracidiphilus sp.]
AAAAMNFHKLLGAFGRIFLRRLLDIHIRSGLQFLRSHETSQTQYQYVWNLLFQDRLTNKDLRLRRIMACSTSHDSPVSCMD